MPAIVALPQFVEELLVQFREVFPNEPARLHFAEYVMGLLVAEQKTVSGMRVSLPPCPTNRASGTSDRVAVGTRAPECSAP